MEKAYTIRLTGDQLNILHDAFRAAAESNEDRASELNGWFPGADEKQLAERLEAEAKSFDDLHELIMSQLESQPVKPECPVCQASIDNGSGYDRDYEGDELYWDEFTCDCGAELTATYQAELVSVVVR